MIQISREHPPGDLGYTSVMSERLTDLATDLEILLAAVDADRNIWRRYVITRSRDLFGWHTVTWMWGRLNGRCTQRMSAFPDELAAIRFTRQLLTRRSTAPRRIGVAYQSRDPAEK